MSESNPHYHPGESSQSAFETAVEALSELRGGTALLPVSPSAHLLPRTPEELVYADCKKIAVKTSIADVRAELGVPQSTTESINTINNYKWEQLSALIAALSQEFDFDDDSVSNLTRISQAIERSPSWGDCNPRRPVSAFVPVLIYRWRKNRQRSNLRRNAQRYKDG
ncbi:hypothetical protein TWF506_004523 [Arthrobotrys conoides]|uniref:Uncharacterized protein n=1 Tax=Arthrobotrys conoides TaxID=74498 RepID=A0AAN8NK80_9PEZI